MHAAGCCTCAQNPSQVLQTAEPWYACKAQASKMQGPALTPLRHLPLTGQCAGRAEARMLHSCMRMVRGRAALCMPSCARDKTRRGCTGCPCPSSCPSPPPPKAGPFSNACQLGKPFRADMVLAACAPPLLAFRSGVLLVRRACGPRTGGPSSASAQARSASPSRGVRHEHMRLHNPLKRSWTPPAAAASPELHRRGPSTPPPTRRATRPPSRATVLSVTTISDRR